MMKAFVIALVLAFGSTIAFAAEDDDKVPEADMAKINATLAEVGCADAEGYKKEEQGIYEIDDAKCKMGPMDKLGAPLARVVPKRQCKHDTLISHVISL